MDTDGRAAVQGIEVVTASGRSSTVGSGDPDFDGSVVSLGALGVVTALELAVQPNFLVEQRVYDGVTWDSLVEHVDSIVACAYSVSVFAALSGPSRIWVKHREGHPEPDLAGTGAVPADGPQHPVRGVDPVNCTDQSGRPPLAPRPHWGKLSSAPVGDLAARYERWSDLRRLGERADPEGKFGNAALDAWLGS